MRSVFVVRYPEVYDPDTPLDPRQAFLAKRRYGQVPVLTVSVVPAGEEMSLFRVAGQFHAPMLCKYGNRVTILSSAAARPSDGSEACETRIA